MGGMGGAAAAPAAAGLAAPGGMARACAAPDPMQIGRSRGPTVPMGELADIRVVGGPPMIKDENGVLVGFVFADIDGTERDLGGWVTDAKALVERELTLPPGYRLQWTGQYEFMAEMEQRLQIMLPVTLALIIGLLYLSMRGWPQTLLVLLSIPFALARSSVWLLALMHYNLSTSVWVGLIAVGGVAAQTGIVMVVYLDEAYSRYRQEGRLRGPADVDAAVLEGAAARVRPLIMTVATTVLGLLPLLWESGVGADVTAHRRPGGRRAALMYGIDTTGLACRLRVLAPVAVARRSRKTGGSQAAAGRAAGGPGLIGAVAAAFFHFFTQPRRRIT
ncbi:efflux RND transporter permease subunit [Massilia sp. H-1]|nr:efflux RND transporter permease subunit [Massilia sp. H-1]